MTLFLAFLSELLGSLSRAVRGQLVLADLQALAQASRDTGYVTENGVIFECIEIDRLNVKMGGSPTGWAPPAP